MEVLFEQLNSGYCLSYLIGSKASAEVALVDPLLDFVDDYMKLLQTRNLKLTHVIDTHTHADHLSGCPKLMDLTGCQYVMHELSSPKCVSHRVKDGEEILVGGIPVRFIHTPGHTRDSVAIQVGGNLITGDVLFLDDGGAGRDDLPGGNPGEHWDSLQKLMKLPDNLMVYPAHEYRNRKPSTLGEQKQRNPFFKPQSREAYIQYLESLRLGPAEWMKPVLVANSNCTRNPNEVLIPRDVPACEVMGTAAGATCSSTAPSAVGGEIIQPNELKKRLDAGEKLVLLDVREKAELTGELGHLPGIIHIPVGEVEQRAGELDKFKNDTIISICKMGGRATRAANTLRAKGFNHIIVMEGGMMKWNDCGLPVKTSEPVGS